MKTKFQSLLTKQLLATLSLLVLLASGVAQGQFTYVTNNGSITITGCSNALSYVTIPDTINGLSVTALKGTPYQGLFGGVNFGVGGVTIPDSVTDIEWSFYYCFNLVNVTIPNSVTNVGDGAFYHSSLSSVTIPSSVLTIGNYAFWNSYSLLTNVTLSEGVQSIGNFAFSGCNKLRSVTIPASVTNIGTAAFADSEGGLTNITVDADNPDYASLSGVLFDKNFTTLLQCPGGTVGGYIVPKSVSSVADYAFFGCVWLTNIYFQGNAPSVGSSTFQNVPAGATVYYLPGTTGWGTTFGGLPTAPWYLPTPLMLNYGVQSNQFGFTISWATNASVMVEACTNLTDLVWQPLQTNVLVNGTNYFSDASWTNFPSRFYRVRTP